MNRVQVLATLHAARLFLLDAQSLLEKWQVEALGRDSTEYRDISTRLVKLHGVIRDIDRILNLDRVVQ